MFFSFCGLKFFFFSMKNSLFFLSLSLKKKKKMYAARLPTPCEKQSPEAAKKSERWRKELLPFSPADREKKGRGAAGKSAEATKERRKKERNEREPLDLSPFLLRPPSCRPF